MQMVSKQWFQASEKVVKKTIRRYIESTANHSKYWDEKGGDVLNARKEWLQNLCDTEKFHHSILSNVEIRELIKNYFTEVRSNFATWVRKHGLVLLEPGINLDLFPPYRISSKELTTKQRNEEIEKGRNNWKTYFSTLNVSKKDTFNAARWIILESGQDEYKRTLSNIAYCTSHLFIQFLVRRLSQEK